MGIENLTLGQVSGTRLHRDRSHICYSSLNNQHIEQCLAPCNHSNSD